MSFFQDIADFFMMIFNSSSPEVKKNQALKKIESELKEIRPVIYKNDFIQPNFAEALRVMYVNCKTIDQVLSNTLCSDDVHRNSRFSEQLILTGFSSTSQDLIESLEYENLKEEGLKANRIEHFIEIKRHDVEKLIKEMNTPVFAKIDFTIDKIKQLSDLCHYNFITVIRLFDNNFNGLDYTNNSNFSAVPLDALETALQDLYYVCADLDITNSLGKAVLALQYLIVDKDEVESKKQKLLEALEKVQSVLKHVFSSDILLKLIRLVKKDPAFEVQKAKYKGQAVKKYAEYLQGRYASDSNRLKVEIKDAMITSEVKELFGEKPLLTLTGYNRDTNLYLKQNNMTTFVWITPMEVLKTFVSVYYNENIKTLLNDIVIEGFFNNPSYKSDFSATVYACNESASRIAEFEKAFEHEGQYDEAHITGLIRDSHKDNDFIFKLRDLVTQINGQAKNLIQAECTNFFDLYKKLGEILLDAKKHNSDIITNLKILIGSSRNRENANALEQQYPLWKIFLEIMKNYAIIGNIENNS